MFVLETRTQRFTFGDSWAKVVSFDEQRDLHRIKECLGSIGSKDVDFMGVRDDKSLWLIEVSDYRRNPPDLRKRTNEGALEDEVAEKVRDTIPALVGACRCSVKKPDKWDPYARALTDRSREISIVLWLEEHPDPRPAAANLSHTRKYGLLKNLKEKLAWLTNRVLIEGRGTYSRTDLDIKVEDIPSS